MGLFGRRRTQGRSVDVLGTTGTPLPDDQAPATLRVAAAGPASAGRSGPVLVSGLLLGPFPVQLVQLSTAIPEPMWPSPGTELPAVADPADPTNFVVDWGTYAGGSVDAAAVSGGAGRHGWDPGPGGAHSEAVAAWLAGQGLTTPDFGGGLDLVAPGLGACLDRAAARYAVVIPSQLAGELMQRGEPVEGALTAVYRLPLPPQMLPSPSASMAWLTFEVTPAGAAAYETTIRFGFSTPERFAEWGNVGTVFPLRRDPAQPSLVTVDLAALGTAPH